jgi:hypothetical protein
LAERQNASYNTAICWIVGSILAFLCGIPHVQSEALRINCAEQLGTFFTCFLIPHLNQVQTTLSCVWHYQCTVAVRICTYNAPFPIFSFTVCEFAEAEFDVGISHLFAPSILQIIRGIVVELGGEETISLVELCGKGEDGMGAV